MTIETLPSWVYTSEAFFRRESERVFRRTWQLVCHQNDIPEPGDYVRLELAGESLFAVRGADGTIRVFYNVCRHRASRLVHDLSGNCGADIRCPYHGWTYGHDGCLVGIPRRADFPGLKIEDIALPSAEVDLALGFVFARLGGEGPTASEILGPVRPELEPYAIPRMTPLGPITTTEIPVNWKVAVDNNIEGYHIPLANPGLQRLFGADYAFHVHDAGLSQAGGPVTERPGMSWSERNYLRLLPDADHLPVERRRSWHYYSMFPSLAFDVYPDMIDFFQILPIAVDRSLIRTRAYGLPDAQRRMRAARYLNDRINRLVAAEDVALVNGVQSGLTSQTYSAGVLSRVEARVLQFHDTLRRHLPEAERLSEAEVAS